MDLSHISKLAMLLRTMRTGAWPRRPLAPSPLVTSSPNAGAAGGIALKHSGLAADALGSSNTIGFIGCDISDLTKQTSKVGELRSAIADGSMTEADVYAEIGEVCNGSKPGREGKELIVVDLTGTGAQDAAIGQVAWEKMG